MMDTSITYLRFKLHSLRWRNRKRCIVKNVKKSTATSYCRDCGNFVCDKCNELHQIWEEFADHQIASLSDIQWDAANLVPSTKKVMYCQKHPLNILKIYCETCGELICNDCIIRLHQGHTYDLVTDIFPRYKEEIASSLQPMKPMKLWLATVDKAIQTLDTRANEIDDQRMNCWSQNPQRNQLPAASPWAAENRTRSFTSTHTAEAQRTGRKEGSVSASQDPVQ